MLNIESDYQNDQHENNDYDHIDDEDDSTTIISIRSKKEEKCFSSPCGWL